MDSILELSFQLYYLRRIGALANPSIVMQIGGCNICGGAYESGMCMAQDDASKKVNYMTNPHCQWFHQRGPPGYHQRGNFSQHQVQGWRSHLGITSTKIKAVHLFDLPIKGLIYMRGPLSWRIV